VLGLQQARQKSVLDMQQRMRASKILITSALITAVLTALALSPFAVDWFKQKKSERHEGVYATGLTSCSQPPHSEMLLQSPDKKFQEGRLIITIFPAFDSPRMIQLSDENSMLVVRKAVMEKRGNNYVPVLSDTKQKPVEKSVTTKIIKALEHEIRNPYGQKPQGLDGVSYTFEVEGVGCGYAWSPNENDRASHVVNIAKALVSYSESGLKDSEFESLLDVYFENLK
jgi:hypothetical protein